MNIKKTLFSLGLLIALTSATLFVLRHYINSGVAAAIGIVGISLIGSWAQDTQRAIARTVGCNVPPGLGGQGACFYAGKSVNKAFPGAASVRSVFAYKGFMLVWACTCFPAKP